LTVLDPFADLALDLVPVRLYQDDHGKVEVKRSTDTRIRREVVGQMLDYAANAVVYWPVERIRAQFERTCQVQGLEAEQVIKDFLDPETDPEEFWQKMKTNLQAGKVRLVFVADKIPSELQRIVEFLNELMDPAEVLALEVKQYMGQGLKTLVPKIIGLTAAVQEKKSSGTRESRQWDEPSFFQDLESRRGVEDVKTARKIIGWAKPRMSSANPWGKGVSYGTFYPKFYFINFTTPLFNVLSTGRIEISFGEIKKAPLFDGDEKRLEFLHRLNQIPGISLSSDSINRYPTLLLSVLNDEATLNQLFGVFDWVIQEIKSVSKD
jgi:hypothetical protein